jgi:predicted DNA-binding transcriptional regulator AlpA
MTNQSAGSSKRNEKTVAILIEALRAMTTERGCTEAEAAAASKIDELLSRYQIDLEFRTAPQVGRNVDEPSTHPHVDFPFPADHALNAQQSAKIVGLALPSFWRAVGAGRLPSPVYPLPRAPRWFASELRAAMLATRALPAEQKVARLRARCVEQALEPDLATKHPSSPRRGSGPARQRCHVGSAHERTL